MSEWALAAEDEVAKLKAEAERLRAENLRLKAALERVVTASPLVPKSELRADAEAALRQSV